MSETQTTAPPPSVPLRYLLGVPKTWWNFDLDPSTRDASIGRRFRAGLKGADVDPSVADRMVRAGRKAAREAHARGALQLSGILEVLGGGTTLIATTMVLRLSPPPEAAPDLSQLMTSYAVHTARNPLARAAGGSVGKAEFIELPHAGQAGRVTYLEDVDFYGKNWARMAIMQTVVPVPGTDDFLIIASSTPCLAFTDEFFGVFDAISGTLRFEFEKEPTVPMVRDL
ncbi:hypothetical protein ACIP5L_28890 [Streptomyces bacillaris]|uniref:hypothetical protein n=1 Tax=Streptomyces bacillaris TaxID=68179 RepID=UPI00380FB0BB